MTLEAATRLDPSDPHLLVGNDTIKTFLTAGRAIFTIRNTQTGNRVTYRIDAVKGEADAFTVSAFTGSDNSVKGHYSPLGTISNGRYQYRGLLAAVIDLKAAADTAGDDWLVGFAGSTLNRNLSKYGIQASPVAFDDMKQRVFYWLWTGHMAQDKELPEQIEVWHEGRCGRCGRRLTVPESIANGLGPECIKLGTVITVAA